MKYNYWHISESSLSGASDSIPTSEYRYFLEQLKELMAVTKFNSYESQVIFKDAAIKGFILTHMEKLK